MSEQPPPSDQPSPESQPETPPPGEAPPSGGESAKDERNLAMLAHLLGIFTWFLGALIIWLVKKESSKFVDDQGKEAINFQITIGILYLGVIVLTCVTFGIGAALSPVVWIANVVFCIIAAVAASGGQWYRYPVAIRLVK